MTVWYLCLPLIHVRVGPLPRGAGGGAESLARPTLADWDGDEPSFDQLPDEFSASLGAGDQVRHPGVAGGPGRWLGPAFGHPSGASPPTR